MSWRTHCEVCGQKIEKGEWRRCKRCRQAFGVAQHGRDRTYETEQTSLDITTTGTMPPRGARPCNALAPDGLTVCGLMFPTGDWCQRLRGHPGGHSKKPSTCNRPLNHEGPHAVLLVKDARRLGEWE